MRVNAVGQACPRPIVPSGTRSSSPLPQPSPLNPSPSVVDDLSQNNIKEVLLFPAMKPEETGTQQSSTRGIGMAEGGAASSGAGRPCGAPASAAAHPPVYASGSLLLDGVDLASPAGIQKFEVCAPCLPAYPSMFSLSVRVQHDASMAQVVLPGCALWRAQIALLSCSPRGLSSVLFFT